METELVCCACGIQLVGVWHTRAGCGKELLWEGATCRGAAGRWEMRCCFKRDDGIWDHARELVFVEAR